jgi:hypothetical protein
MLVVAEIIEEAVTGVTPTVTGKINGVTHTVTHNSVTHTMTPAERARKYRQNLKKTVTATVTPSVTPSRPVVTLSPTPPLSDTTKGLENKGFEGKKERVVAREAVTAVTAVTDLKAKSEKWFALFWAEYPRREGNNSRKAAFSKFVTALRHGATIGEIMEGVTAYSSHCDVTGVTGTRYVQMAVTWLNQEGWKTKYGVQAQQQATRLPQDWIPEQEDVMPFIERGLKSKIFDRELEKFRNHYQSAAGKTGLSLDWRKQYINWMIRVEENGKLQG